MFVEWFESLSTKAVVKTKGVAIQAAIQITKTDQETMTPILMQEVTKRAYQGQRLQEDCFTQTQQELTDLEHTSLNFSVQTQQVEENQKETIQDKICEQNLSPLNKLKSN